MTSSSSTASRSGQPDRLAVQAQTPGKRRKQGSQLRKRLQLTFLLTPALVLFIGFVLVPIVVASYYSVYKWNGFNPVMKWAGWGNFDRAIHDTVFDHAIWHNVEIALLSLFIQLPIQIALALLLNRKLRGRGFLRLVVFAPYILSEAVTAVIWIMLLQPDGFVDQIFKFFGAGGLIHSWLGNTHLVLYTLFVVITWKYIGFGIVLLLAGLQGIPGELREAAALDGATPWQATRRVTLPLLGPTIRILIFLSMIGSLQLFDLVWIMTLGGPAGASTTMATYLINKGFQSYEFGYGSAVAVIMFVICFAFALLYQRFALRRDTQGALTRGVT